MWDLVKCFFMRVCVHERMYIKYIKYANFCHAGSISTVWIATHEYLSRKKKWFVTLSGIRNVMNLYSMVLWDTRLWTTVLIVSQAAHIIANRRTITVLNNEQMGWVFFIKYTAHSAITLEENNITIYDTILLYRYLISSGIKWMEGNQYIKWRARDERRDGIMKRGGSVRNKALFVLNFSFKF
jgi:hypothetical protein